jgi:hypothetical protein
VNDPQLIREGLAAITADDLSHFSTLSAEHSHFLSLETPLGPWLHVAAARNRTAILKFLLDHGADLNRTGGVSGDSALGRAASKGAMESVALLLSHGALLDVSAPERNPLFSAIYGGHLGVARLLIEAGIDTSIWYTGPNMPNIGALEFAHARGQTEIAALLQSPSPTSENPRSS